ncbi:hypothetical protein EJ04DRAFT_478724 [Polyplosphaeria fusca]|uniref:F-box domain-containing protein n=1 Tax=Polyplosphaeria fusca TaxID=682080 RepID=A0A9P4QJU4_9PLEO|nr:hypothetical protein EJ04DRAFT_478724 [Polyplosphaeria fusca]
MSACHIYKLPNELFLYLLTPLPTPELLQLASISHRIYTLILRILQQRLVAASELQSHSLLLECYHPSAKLTEPPYFCTYHGTDGLFAYESPIGTDQNLAGRLGEMHSIYSRFRPHRRELETGGRRVVRPPGDIPGSRTFPGAAREKYSGETVKQILSLDGHELFTQLVAQINLVKVGPRNGLFTCFVGVEDAVLRVWREWLRDSSFKNRFPENMVRQEGKGKNTVRELHEMHRSAEGEHILWVTPSKNTGFRFNVRERQVTRDLPVFVNADEDLPVSYEIEYDELLVRTSHLALMLEKSLVQEDNSSGKAVVFGSFG